MLQRMHGISFNWSRWRSGCLLDLGLLTRYKSIIEGKEIIKKYAIGYCPGESVICRPKTDRVAVMFLKDDLLFWNHLLNKEFDEIFTELLTK